MKKTLKKQLICDLPNQTILQSSHNLHHHHHHNQHHSSAEHNTYTWRGRISFFYYAKNSLKTDGIFFPLYQNHKKTARRFKIKYSNGQKKQKQEAQGKYEMSTLSLRHTLRYGFDCVFLDFFASSGFGTRIKTKLISNDIFFTRNTLFSLFFLVKSTNPANKTTH